MPEATFETFNTIVGVPYPLDMASAIQDGSNPFTPDKSVLGGAPKYKLKSAAANNTAITAGAAWRLPMPRGYKADQTFVVRVNAKVDVSPNVHKKVDVQFFKCTDGAAAGSDLCTTAEQLLTTSDANYDFTITPTTGGGTLARNEEVLVVVKGDLDDTGGSGNKYAYVNSVQILADLRGG